MTAVPPDRAVTFDGGAKAIVLASAPLSSLAITGITPVLPQIADALEAGHHSLMTKQLVGIVGLAMAIGSPLAGFLIKRLPARGFLVGALLLYAAAGTAGLYLTSLPILLVSRFLVGLTAACFIIMAYTMINTRLEGERRARWMGIQVALAMVSALAITPASGFLGAISWRLPFGLFALGLPVAVVAWRLLDDGRASAAGVGSPGFSRRAFAWYPWSYVLLALAIGTVTYIPIVYAPFLMRELGARSPAFVGIILTADSMVGALLALGYGRSRRWIDANATFAVSFGFVMLGTGVAALGGSLPSAVAGLLLLGLGMGWLIPNLLISLSTKVAASHQSEAAGITKCFHYLSSPLAILLLEPFAAQAGPRGAILVTMVLSGMLALLFLIKALSGARSGDILRGTS